MNEHVEPLFTVDLIDIVSALNFSIIMKKGLNEQCVNKS